MNCRNVYSLVATDAERQMLWELVASHYPPEWRDEDLMEEILWSGF